MSYDSSPDPQNQWPPPYERQPMGIIASIVAAITAAMGLMVVAFFIFMVIALNNMENSK
jgi:hypothetical protein